MNSNTVLSLNNGSFSRIPIIKQYSRKKVSIIMKFKEKFQQFMYGRYGVDEFSRTMIYICLGMFLVSRLLKIHLLNTLAFALIIYCYYRILSRNIYKRAQENQKYLEVKAAFLNKLQKEKKHAEQLKDYRFFKCPTCKQKVRVPRGKGKIKIHCPRCHNDFIKKS